MNYIPHYESGVRVIESSKVTLVLQIREPGDAGWSTINRVSGHRDNIASYDAQLRKYRDGWQSSGYFAAGASYRSVRERVRST